MPQRLRIFISSPADVPDERLRAALIVDKLSQDYSRFFSIETYRWEHEAMLASAHFQDAIEPPSAFDMVVLILWSRLGTPLPEKTAEREYRGIDGRAPVTGTEWEYEEALKVARERKAPDLLAFRNISLAPIDPRDPEARARSNAQLDALDQFWRRHFADKGVFLAAYDEYHTLEEFAQRLEESLRKLIERRIKDFPGLSLRTEPIWLGDPFRGLESYEFEHAPIFFGRDAAITKATEQLTANGRAGRAFLLVSGASGSGKSSLVKAGVVTRLMKPQRVSGTAFLRRVVFRPSSEGADVFLGLAKALTRAGVTDVGLPELIAPGQDAAELAAHLRGAPANSGYLIANALGRLTEAGRKSGRLLAFEDAKLILIVDQLEELFTVLGIAPSDRRLLIQVLAGLARSGAVWVIATVRADFWHRAAEIPELIALAEGQGRIDLATASPAELAEMIRKPAEATGLSFEEHPQTGLGLDSVLAQDAAAAPGALPLLSFTLDELYKDAKARGATQLTYASYEALGGLEGAIAKRADEILDGLPVAARAAAPRVLRALTTVSGATAQMPVARSAPLERFAEGSPARLLIDAFIAARLLVAADESGTAATVRLAHEALISRWQRARDQLATDHRDLQTRAIVERQFGRWNEAKGYARWLLLLRNPDLANAVDLAKRWGDELEAPLRDFINRSARRARLAQTLTAAAAVLFAIVAATAFYAERQAKRALAATMEIDDIVVLNIGVDPRLRDLPPDLLTKILDRVIDSYTKVIFDSKLATAYRGRGDAYRYKYNYDNDDRDLDHAIEDYTDAINLDAKDAAAFNNRGLAYAAKGDNDRAIADYDQAIQLDPKSSDAYHNRGDAYSGKSDHERAIADYARAGLAHAAEGANYRAIDDYTKVIDLDPKLAMAYRGRGDAYRLNYEDDDDEGDLDHAISDYTEAITIDPNDAAAFNGRGLAYAAKGDNYSAIDDYTKSIDLNPNSSDAYHNRGEAYSKALNLDPAIADYTKAIALDPKSSGAYDDRGDAYSKKGDLKRAFADYAEAIRFNPKDSIYRYRRGKAYSAERDFDSAIADYTEAIKLDAKDPAYRIARGNAYVSKKDYDRAIADYTEAIALDPKDFSAYGGRGYAYEAKKDYDNAIADFTEAIQKTGPVSVYFDSRCWVRAVAGRDLARALDDCNQALSFSPGDGATLKSRGLVQLKLGAFDRAIADYSAAIAKNDKDAGSLYGRGVAKLKSGDTDGGNADIAAAKAIRPDIAEVYAGYGVT